MNTLSQLLKNWTLLNNKVANLLFTQNPQSKDPAFKSAIQNPKSAIERPCTPDKQNKFNKCYAILKPDFQNIHDKLKLCLNDGNKYEVLVNYRNTYFTRDPMQLSNLENLDGLLAVFHHLV
jgi:hypothetical protein